MRKNNADVFKVILLTAALLLVLTNIPVYAADAGKLEVDIDSSYTTGSPVVISIRLTDTGGKPLDLPDPQALKISIKKPDGSMVESVARKSSWNKPGEYYDIFTVDTMGPYKVTVTDGKGTQGAADFNSVFVTSGSVFVIVLAVVMLLGSSFYWRKSLGRMSV